MTITTPAGLGTVPLLFMLPEAEQAGREIAKAPWFCSLPLSDWTPACRIPTINEQRSTNIQDQRAVCSQSIKNYGFATLPDGTRVSTVEECVAGWLNKFGAHPCDKNPNDPDCIRLRSVEMNPALSRLVGPDWARTFGSDPLDPPDRAPDPEAQRRNTKFLWALGIGSVLVIALFRFRGR